MDPARIVELEALALQEPMNAVIDRGDSDVQQYYKDASVFLTGGGGFLGKQCVEKLFRSTAIRKVYLLMRPKKGNNVQDRLKTMLSDPVFDAVRQKKPDFEDKIVPVEGDVAELRLGLSDKDYTKLTEEVTLIFHMAATIRFDAHIKTATLTNVRGTRELIKLARECKNIKCFVHVSTSYTHATANRVQTELKEQFYPSPIHPDVLIQMAESVDEQRLEDMTPHLIKDWYNTYTFTKAVAEDLVRTSTDGIPTCVVRPPVVIPAYCEPAPGWTDLSTVFGICGVLVGAGLGVIHTIYTKCNYVLNIAPVDLVNNAIIVAAWDSDTLRNKGDKIPVYSVTGERCGVDFGFFEKSIKSERITRLVTPLAVWYCFSLVTDNSIIYWLTTWFLHFIPAYVVDAVFNVFGIKIKGLPSVKYVYTKIYKSSKVLSPFCLNKWYFKDDNLVKMISRMSENDRKIYNCDVKTVNYVKYVEILSIGLRKYIVKDGLKDTDKAVRKQTILYYANIVFMIVYVYVLYLIVYYMFKSVQYIVSVTEMDPARIVELEALALQEPMNAVIDRGDSDVQQYYKDASVFVTGGGGFLGKQCVEKLFRSTAIRKVYLLMRPKKGNNVQDRLKTMLSDPVFDAVRQKKPDFEDKIVPVEGDVAELRLGLSDEDYTRLAQEVTLIFHMAATVRFEAHIKDATLINVRGTREVITLGRSCNNLKCFVHVSTTYAHATTSRMGTELKEQFYPTPIQPDVLIQMAENIDEQRLADMTAILIKDWYNTYSFTKAVAEELVRTSTDGIPTCIVKPPAVFPAYYEPAPGWTDFSTMFGVCGLTVGFLLGVIHTIYAKNCNPLSTAPVDLVNNAIIVAAWDSDTLRNKGDKIPVYIVTGERTGKDFGFIARFLHLDRIRRLSTPLAVWYTFSLVTDNAFIYWITTWFLHYIPAYIIDAVFKVIGIKIKGLPSISHVYAKIYKASEVMGPFLTNIWSFKDDNLVKMISRMSENDRKIYNCDVMSIDYDKYIEILIIGFKKYILKDGLKDTDKAVRKQTILYYVNIVFMIVYVYVLYLIVYYMFKSVQYIVY